MVGMANGLSVTMFGGDLLPAETTVTSGKGKVTLTGKLGDVMQESAHAAVTYVRSRSLALGLEPDFHEHVDFHVHFPEGAVPKDGPSAGVTVVTSLVSSLLNVPVRKDVAMTGEINLRGKVLPVGGIKEKVLAAYRADIKTVVCPRENEKDLHEIPKHVLKAVGITFADTIDDALRLALVPLPEGHCNEALAEFLEGGRQAVQDDWRSVREFIANRERKEREARERESEHGPH
jgi:ATP-dependent Lon protease